MVQLLGYQIGRLAQHDHIDRDHVPSAGYLNDAAK